MKNFTDLTGGTEIPGMKKLFRSMKLTSFFLLISVVSVFAGRSYSQSKTLNLNLGKTTVKEVLSKIEDQSDFYFMYNSNYIDLDREVSINATNQKIDAVLDLLFTGTNVDYTIKDKIIVLSTPKLNSTFSLQEKTISGRVTDSSGAPLPGVSIVVKGTTQGIITDADGNYTLDKVPADAILVFSFVGMKSQEIAMTGKPTINVVMQEETIGLDEVVAIGYGTMKKSDLTGAVGSLKTSNIEDEHPKNLQDILRGNIAGLNIGMSTDAKGGGDIEIRGTRTLKAGTSPLLVLDGTIYNGELSDINPNDIESIDILKDASSAAVFGAKSANGVILINTKTGKTGKPTINVDVNLGVSSLFRSEDVYGPYEFIDWRIDVEKSINRSAPEYMYNDPRSLPSGISLSDWLAYDSSQGDEVEVWLRRLNMSDPEISNYIAGKSTNWKNMVFRTGLEQDYNVSLSGKTEKLTYYWSLGYTDNEGVIVNDDYSIYRSRLRFEAKVTDFLSVGLNTLFLIRDESGYPVAWKQYVSISPWGEPYNDDGTYKIYPTDDGVAAYNPMIDSYYIDKKYLYKSLDNVLFSKINLPFGIKYEFNFSPRFTNDEKYLHKSSEHPEWGLVGGSASRTTESSLGWQIDNILRWEKTFNKVHQLNLTLLANAEKYRTWYQTMSNQEFVPSDVLGYHDIGSGTVAEISSEDTYSTGDAYMARLFYSYKSKYLFTGTVRRDGYSAFGMKNPRATFPSLALGWLFSEENFAKVPWLNYGKLRLSWGANGNRDIGIYDALSSLTNGMISYVDATTGEVYQESYLNASNMGNQSLKWEKTNSLNLGLDLTLFDEAISTNIDVYTMTTKDLLVDRSLPSVTGYSSVASNLGEIQNKGFEITINTRNVNTPDFKWKTSFNFSLNRNKIKSLYGNMEDIYDDNGNVIGQKESDDISNGWFIGHAIDAIWGYKVTGVWQSGEEEEAAKYNLEPGDFKLEDVNGDYTFTNKDKQFLGYKNPRFRWSLRNDFNICKNIDFSFSAYSYWGQKATLNEVRHNSTLTIDRLNSYKIPYWTEDNPTNKFARLNSGMAGVSYNVWRSLSFVRLDNISLSYRVPDYFLQKYKIKKLNVSLSARNVAVWVKDYHIWDPEYSGPTPSFITLGINMSL